MRRKITIAAIILILALLPWAGWRAYWSISRIYTTQSGHLIAIPGKVTIELPTGYMAQVYEWPSINASTTCGVGNATGATAQARLGQFVYIAELRRFEGEYPRGNPPDPCRGWIADQWVR